MLQKNQLFFTFPAHLLLRLPISGSFKKTSYCNGIPPGMARPNQSDIRIRHTEYAGRNAFALAPLQAKQEFSYGLHGCHDGHDHPFLPELILLIWHRKIGISVIHVGSAAQLIPQSMVA